MKMIRHWNANINHHACRTAFLFPGTIYTAAEEIEAAGGRALPCVVDVRDEQAVGDAVESAIVKFGGLDILVNNASAIALKGTLDVDMKR